MMLLSRFWYVILALVMSVAIALVYVGVHQHNRVREADLRIILDHDRDVVDWFLRLDARKRLDALALVSIDQKIRDGIAKATPQEKIGADVRKAVTARLLEISQSYANVIRDEGKGGANPNALFVVDGRGRVVAHVNFDRTNLIKDENNFELGGHPVVADALHGWLRDDTWVLDREAMYRVVARPVVTTEGSLAAGAAVAMRRVEASFVSNVAERTSSPVLFFVIPQGGEDQQVRVLAGAAPQKTNVSWDGLIPDGKSLQADKGYQNDGLSELKTMGLYTVAYQRMIGHAWSNGGGFAVARKGAPLDGPGSVLSNANESDKKAIPWPLLIALGLGSVLVGIGATLFEHSFPTRRMVDEAKKLAKGDQDALPLAKLSGPLRTAGKDINDGIERIISKGGGASRKAADLEQILGPMPAVPQMSAFSFGLDTAPESKNPAEAQGPSFGLAVPAVPPAPASVPKPAQGAPSVPQLSNPTGEDEDDDATMVSKIPNHLIQASATGEMPNAGDEMSHWKQTFEDFVALRSKLGENTQGLSFEKFQVQLRKNKEALVKQYGCKKVRFSVYEKDKKAALKATPIKE